MIVPPRFAVEDPLFVRERSAFSTGQTTGVVVPDVLFARFGSLLLVTIDVFRRFAEQSN